MHSSVRHSLMKALQSSKTAVFCALFCHVLSDQLLQSSKTAMICALFCHVLPYHVLLDKPVSVKLLSVLRSSGVYSLIKLLQSGKTVVCCTFFWYALLDKTPPVHYNCCVLYALLVCTL